MAQWDDLPRHAESFGGNVRREAVVQPVGYEAAETSRDGAVSGEELRELDEHGAARDRTRKSRSRRDRPAQQDMARQERLLLDAEIDARLRAEPGIHSIANDAGFQMLEEQRPRALRPLERAAVECDL